METLMINLVIGLAVALFGAMAIFPMLMAGKPARRTPLAHDDDQVISIQPVATTPRSLRPVAPLGEAAVEAPGGNQRHAA